MRRARFLAAIIVLLTATLALSGTALAAPGMGEAPTVTAFAPNPCKPNPSPAPRGQATIVLASPETSQNVSSSILLRGKANAGSTFRVVLYDAVGGELAAINAAPNGAGDFFVSLAYRLTAEQEGCLWLFNSTGANGGGDPINVVQRHIHLRATVGACYAETRGVCAEDYFQRFWSGNGGLYQFGFPLAPGAIETGADGNQYLVQYFERARFEYHPESKDPQYQTLLGLLGNTVTTDRRAAGEAPFVPTARPEGCEAAPAQCPVAGGVWFAGTGHLLGAIAGRGAGPDGAAAGGAIAAQWANRGGLAVYGLPISAVFAERGYDGNTYLVQYFERHRLEYHPENAAPYDVLLGQLGRQVYAARPAAR